jgi:tetratricopeptide (TPR) repeat protein
MRIYKIIILFLLTLNLSSCFITKKSGTSNTNKDVKQEKAELNFKYSFFEANKNKMLGNYENAISYYIKCTEFLPEEPSPYYELAGLSVSYKDLVSAQKYAEKACKLDTENKWYKIMLADVSKRSGNLKRTVEILNELTVEYPEISEYHLELAATYLAMNKPNDAIKEYEFMEQNYGESELISYEKERIYSNMHDYNSSRKELVKLIKLNPGEANYYGILAESYLSAGNTIEAKKVYDMLLEIDPNNGIAFLSLSEYFRITENNDSSFSYLKKAFESDDVKIETKIQILVNNYTNQISISDNKAKSVELLTLLENNYPKEPKIYMIKADFLMQENKMEEASSFLKKSLELDKNNRNVWEQLLLIEYQLQQFENLEKDSKSAIEYFPNYASFYLFNGTALFLTQKYLEATKILKIGLNYVVDNDVQLMQFYIYLGDAYDSLKKYEDSDKYFDKVLEIDPVNDLVLNNYSYYLAVRSDKLDKAQEMSKIVIERNPGSANYLDTYAWILYKKGNYKSAIEYLERAIKLGGNNNAAILEHYGDALYKNKLPINALDAWKKANRIDPSDTLLKKIESKSIL